MKLILAVRIADTAPRNAAGAEQDAPLHRNAVALALGLARLSQHTREEQDSGAPIGCRGQNEFAKLGDNLRVASRRRSSRDMCVQSGLYGRPPIA